MKRLWLVLIFSAPLFGQGIRYDNVDLLPSGRGVIQPSVAVCTSPANTSIIPCSPLAKIYSNQALTTALPNPFIGDNYGNYGFWAAPAHYVVQISTPAVQTAVMDVFLPWDPSSASLEDKGGQLFNVKAFGAKADGVTDDTAAINAAISAANIGGGIVYFPPGTYYTSATLAYTQYNVSMVGAGKEVAIIDYHGSVDAISARPSSWTNGRGFKFADFTVTCATAGSGVGLHFGEMNHALFSNLLFRNCAKGWWGDNENSHWTEEIKAFHLASDNSTLGFVFSNPSGLGISTSFAYGNFDFYCQLNEGQLYSAGAACVKFENNAIAYSGNFLIKMNGSDVAGAAPAIWNASSAGQYDSWDIRAEGPSANHPNWYQTSSTGTLDGTFNMEISGFTSANTIAGGVPEGLTFNAEMESYSCSEGIGEYCGTTLRLADEGQGRLSSILFQPASSASTTGIMLNPQSAGATFRMAGYWGGGTGCGGGNCANAYWDFLDIIPNYGNNGFPIFPNGLAINNSHQPAGSNSSAFPVCSVDTEFLIYAVPGATGVKDSVQICAKDATNAYAWRTIY